MFYFLAFIFVILVLFIRFVPKEHTKRYRTADGIAEKVIPIPFPFKVASRIAIGAFAIFLSLGLFNSIFFYAEPGYYYHVRTITGQEKRVDDVGYNIYLFGRYNKWKKSMSIVAKAQYEGVNEDSTEAENENDNMTSSILGPVRTIFLDQVDSQISATARFMLPADEPSFLDIARQYRSPDNLIRTTLLPAFRETLQANAALMGAEDYFAGKRTEFNIDFEEQLKNGLYLVQRKEILQKAPTTSGSADASKGTAQEDFGTTDKVIFVVEKIVDRAGIPIRKAQSYAALGITVVESRITDVVPNREFSDRMKLKQKASADRAIAREQRIQEEEQQLLAVAKGDRIVAEEQATWKKDQIAQTTKQETAKAVALITASRQLEQARIEKATAAEVLLRDEISAKSIEVLADAAAYKKRVVIQADNALTQKLATEERIQKYWADAFAVRKVPTTVFTSGGAGGATPTGSNVELQNMVSLMTMNMAEKLDYARHIKK